MIIVGTMQLSFKQSTGEFFCPTCGAEQPYVQKVARLFLTLYFIPLIPMQRVGEFIQCKNCRQKYDLGILDYDPESERQALYQTYLRILTLKMITEGWVEPEHLERLRWIFRNRFDVEPIDDEIFQAVDESESFDARYEDYARQISQTYDANTCADIFYCLMQLDSIQPSGNQEGEMVELTAHEKRTRWIDLAAPLGLSNSNLPALMDHFEQAIANGQAR